MKTFDLGCHSARVWISNTDFVILPLFGLQNGPQVLMPADNYMVRTHEVSTSVSMSHRKTSRLHNSGQDTPARAGVSSGSDNDMEDISSFLIASLILRKVQR